ncbi:RNA polymerase sigma factor [Azospirillum sp. sgz301742]
MPTSFDGELVECIPELRRYAHKLAGEHAAAEDLVQDCLERALRNADKFAPGTNLEAWLMTILKHLFFTECRRNQRRPHVELDEHDSVVPAPQIARIALDEVGEAIEALPPRQRGLIELVSIDGVSYQEAAQRLGVPVGTIRSRLSRAREQIRHNMERRRRVERPLAPRAAPPLPHGGSKPSVSPATPTPTEPPTAPTVRRPRPSALPACLAALSRHALPGQVRVPHATPALLRGWPWRVPAQGTIHLRGPPAIGRAQWRRPSARIDAVTPRWPP